MATCFLSMMLSGVSIHCISLHYPYIIQEMKTSYYIKSYLMRWILIMTYLCMYQHLAYMLTHIPKISIIKGLHYFHTFIAPSLHNTMSYNVARPMIYRNLHHYLSRYMPTQVFTNYDLLGLFLSWVPIPQRISVLLPTLVLDTLHILKEYQMPYDNPILPLFLPK